MQSEITISPKLTVAAFGCWHMFEQLPPGTRADWQSGRRNKVRHACRAFRDWLKREPVIADLTRENIVAVLADCGSCHWRVTKDVLRALRKLAIDMGLLPKDAGTILSLDDARGRNRRGGFKPEKRKQPTRPTLSRAEGTLWALCHKRYFPTSLRIRKEITRRQYQFALENLRDYIGHDPTPADLTEDNVLGMMVMLRDQRKLDPRTVNGYRGRICALWTWMAKKRIVAEFPTVGTLKAPRRLPKAWTRDQLEALFAACDRQRGWIAGVPAALWMRSLHAVLWDSSERIGALMDLEWIHVDLDRALLQLPAEIRKGDEERCYTLHPDTVAELRKLKAVHDATGSSGRVWPWDRSEGYLWTVYKRVRKDAGLPDDTTGKSGFHRMRRSVASHMVAAGADATAALGHSSAALTRRSYIDPSVAGQVTPAQILFRPNAE